MRVARSLCVGAGATVDRHAGFPDSVMTVDRGDRAVFGNGPIVGPPMIADTHCSRKRKLPQHGGGAGCAIEPFRTLRLCCRAASAVPTATRLR